MDCFNNMGATGTTTTSSSTASDDEIISTLRSTHINNNEKSLPIPASLVKEQWRLIFTADANERDLEAAIAHCRDLVLIAEECSEERRWLVRHLVDLRLALIAIQDANSDACETPMPVKTVVGHHFVLQRQHQGQRSLQTTAAAALTRQYCDHCASFIWNLVHVVYVCKDCQYLAHEKCVDSVVRICAHVVVSEREYPINIICPEMGLSAQLYKCAECQVSLNCKSSIEPRLCDYSGLYYCHICHWNDMSVIPSRIICNWDHSTRRVSRASLQEINLFLNKPLIKLEEANPKLFIFLEKLAAIKKLRQQLVYMRKYLIECRQAQGHKLMDLYINGNQRHLIQTHEYYSLNDLLETEAGTLHENLQHAFNAFNVHIRECNLCLARAYRCEICSNDEVIFPFDDGCVLCDKCNSIYHRVCFTRKNGTCPKCVRLQERKSRNNNDDDLSTTTTINTKNNENDNDDILIMTTTKTINTS